MATLGTNVPFPSVRIWAIKRTEVLGKWMENLECGWLIMAFFEAEKSSSTFWSACEEFWATTDPTIHNSPGAGTWVVFEWVYHHPSIRWTGVFSWCGGGGVMVMRSARVHNMCIMSVLQSPVSRAAAVSTLKTSPSIITEQSSSAAHGEIFFCSVLSSLLSFGSIFGVCEIVALVAALQRDTSKNLVAWGSMQ